MYSICDFCRLLIDCRNEIAALATQRLVLEFRTHYIPAHHRIGTLQAADRV